jgi:hypothetical protein
MPRFAVYVIPPRGEWTHLGDFTASGEDCGIDIDHEWPAGKGHMMAIPIAPEEWASVPGFYDVELSVHGSHGEKPFEYVDPNKDVNPDDITAGPQAPEPAAPGPNRKARRAAKKAGL